MNREELYSAILAARPSGDKLVYIERRGKNYAWRYTLPDADVTCEGPGYETGPDVWIYYSGRWPAQGDGPGGWLAFFDDLLEEMESMAGGKDRCRWPLDEPWPHRH